MVLYGIQLLHYVTYDTDKNSSPDPNTRPDTDTDTDTYTHSDPDLDVMQNIMILVTTRMISNDIV